MGLAVLTGVVALVSVALGAMLTHRSQRVLLVEGHRQGRLTAREKAYVEYLAAYRSFRRFLLTQPTSVTLIPRDDDPHQHVTVIEGADRHWEAVDSATAQLLILAAGRPALDFASAVRETFYEVATARATYGPGAVPAAVVRRAKRAEEEFALAAERDLR